MGLLLIGGTILLFVLAFKKMAKDEPESGTAHIPLAYRECSEQTLHLPDVHLIERVAFDGSVARLVTRDEQGRMALVLVDGCKGTKLGQVTLSTGETKE